MSKKRKVTCPICYGEGKYWNKIRKREEPCVACSEQGYLWTE